MNFSFGTEYESLAESFGFFAECCSKVLLNREDDRLLELNEKENHQTIVILPPQYEFKLNGDQVAHDELKDQVTFKNSAFIYTLQKLQDSNHTFPYLKIELGVL